MVLLSVNTEFFLTAEVFTLQQNSVFTVGKYAFPSNPEIIPEKLYAYRFFCTILGRQGSYTTISMKTSLGSKPEFPASASHDNRTPFAYDYSRSTYGCDIKRLFSYSERNENIASM